MSYTSLYTRSKKSKIAALWLAAVFAVVMLSFFISHNSNSSRASQIALRRVEIGSITPSSADIYIETVEDEEATLVLTNTQSGEVTLLSDARQHLSPLQRKDHIFTASGLSANTEYTFLIQLGSRQFAPPSGTNSFKTLSIDELSKGTVPLSGKILAKNNAPVENAVVIAKFLDGKTLIAITSINGEWLMPLVGGSSYTGQTPIIFEAQLPGIGLERVVVKKTLGQAQSGFTSIAGTIADATTQQPAESAVLGAETAATDDQIIYPLPGASLSSPFPLYKGKGSSGDTVQLFLNTSRTPFATVTVDAQGVWSYTPTEPLDPGSYVLSVQFASNKHIVKRAFSVQKSGERVMSTQLGMVLGETTASPSASFTPSPSRTVSPTRVVPTPTVMVYTPAKTITPTPPVTGVSGLFAIVGSILFIVAGFVLMTFA